MLEIRSAVEIKDDAVGLHGDRGDGDAVSGRGRLPLLVQHLFVGVATWLEVAVRHQDEILAKRKWAVRKALLRLKVTNQFPASALGDWSRRQLDLGGVEVGGDVGHGGLFADHKDLRARQRGRSRQHRDGANCRCEKRVTKGHGGHLV